MSGYELVANQKVKYPQCAMDWNALLFGCCTKTLVTCDKGGVLRLRQNKAKQIGARWSEVALCKYCNFFNLIPCQFPFL